jgi:erythromycin esterase
LKSPFGRSHIASHSSLDQWIAQDAIRFVLDDVSSFEAAVDRVIGSLAEPVQLLGFCEALHGSEEILVARNMLFQRLVMAHGYSAVAIEVTSPQARAMNEYVLGLRDAGDLEVQEWFANGFGLLDANRELIEWMRRYNSDAAATVKLHFYGIDLPLGQGGLASPERVFEIVFQYLEIVDPDAARRLRDRIIPLLGEAADWERPAAFFDPAQSIGLSPAATELRIAGQDLITELRIRRPELVAKSDPLAFAEALHHADLALKLLNAHAALATPGAYAQMLGIRDLMMADNLGHIVSCESARGKVLVFAASGHLKRTMTQWRLPPGDEVKEWWPAGSHLTETFGPRYALIGMALGVSEENGIGSPEPGTLEARLLEAGGSFFIPTHRGKRALGAAAATLPVRSGSTLNPTYAPLTAESLEDFDCIVFFDATKYPRGALPLTAWNTG